MTDLPQPLDLAAIQARATRKHLAKRWYGPTGLTIKCTCGQWQSTSGTRREQDEAHRNHRWTMGELVKPGQPSRIEQLTAENAALLARVAELEQQLATVWPCTCSHLPDAHRHDSTLGRNFCWNCKPDGDLHDYQAAAPSGS